MIGKNGLEGNFSLDPRIINVIGNSFRFHRSLGEKDPRNYSYKYLNGIKGGNE